GGQPRAPAPAAQVPAQVLVQQVAARFAEGPPAAAGRDQLTGSGRASPRCWHPAARAAAERPPGRIVGPATALEALVIRRHFAEATAAVQASSTPPAQGTSQAAAPRRMSQAVLKATYTQAAARRLEDAREPAEAAEAGPQAAEAAPRSPSQRRLLDADAATPWRAEAWSEAAFTAGGTRTPSEAGTLAGALPQALASRRWRAGYSAGPCGSEAGPALTPEMSVYDASERGRMASHGAASTASDRHRVAQEFQLAAALEELQHVQAQLTERQARDPERQTRGAARRALTESKASKEIMRFPGFKGSNRETLLKLEHDALLIKKLSDVGSMLDAWLVHCCFRSWVVQSPQLQAKLVDKLVVELSGADAGSDAYARAAFELRGRTRSLQTNEGLGLGGQLDLDVDIDPLTGHITLAKGDQDSVSGTTFCPSRLKELESASTPAYSSVTPFHASTESFAAARSISKLSDGTAEGTASAAEGAAVVLEKAQVHKIEQVPEFNEAAPPQQSMQAQSMQMQSMQMQSAQQHHQSAQGSGDKEKELQAQLDRVLRDLNKAQGDLDKLQSDLEAERKKKAACCVVQ
ncbi:unnamed protein product, partial [Prorocentrum cordatum]